MALAVIQARTVFRPTVATPAAAGFVGQTSFGGLICKLDAICPFCLKSLWFFNTPFRLSLFSICSFFTYDPSSNSAKVFQVSSPEIRCR